MSHGEAQPRGDFLLHHNRAALTTRPRRLSHGGTKTLITRFPRFIRYKITLGRPGCFFFPRFSFYSFQLSQALVIEKNEFYQLFSLIFPELESI